MVGISNSWGCTRTLFHPRSPDSLFLPERTSTSNSFWRTSLSCSAESFLQMILLQELLVPLVIHLLLFIIPGLVLLLVILVAGFIAVNYAWHPHSLRKLLLKQKLRGPPPKFMLGNMHQVSEMREAASSKDMLVGDHDLLSRICPHFSHWSAIYGKRFLFWWGVEPRITVVEPELIKEILCTKAEQFGKSLLQKKGGVLLMGNGMVYANGESWAHRRRIVGPAFHVEQLKKMVPEMVKSTSFMLERWSEMIGGESSAEIDINYHLSKATADVIARTAFGSSHEKGTRVFELLTCLQKVFAQSNRYLWLPCNRLLPTAINKSATRIKNEIEQALRDLINERRAAARETTGDNETKKQSSSSSSYGNDFLGLMLSESDSELQQEWHPSKTKPHFQTAELIEECKTIFFTGHETTSSLLTWTLMLLALHPEWQERGRAEVQELLARGQAPDPDQLWLTEPVAFLPVAFVMQLGMILNETLRLYPPAPALVRESLADLELGDMSIPRGTTFWIPILAIHHNRELWGDDAKLFNPERFSEGVAKACKLQSEFMPFSLGPRACVGQTFAMMEAKVVLAMILQSFSFRLSPGYRHAPVTSITLKPKYGMQLIVSRV